MFKNKNRAFALAIILTMVVAVLPSGFTFANNADVTLVSTMRQGEPITSYTLDSANISTLDPQLATDSVSIDFIENLFLGLTDADALVPGQINPELATEWSVSEDGLTWTFTLRDDVPWVQWDPVNDEANVLRNVTAADVEYGIKRACDPRVLAEYGYVVSGVVAGCADTLGMDAAEFTDADRDLVQVTALDDTTLQVGLNFPASYFLSETTMWVYRPVPQEVIEEYGDNWTEPGNLTTNGPFVMDEWVRGVRRVLLRNPMIPPTWLAPATLSAWSSPSSRMPVRPSRCTRTTRLTARAFLAPSCSRSWKTRPTPTSSTRLLTRWSTTSVSPSTRNRPTTRTSVVRSPLRAGSPPGPRYPDDPLHASWHVRRAADQRSWCWLRPGLCAC